jgi:hypothetical protein
MIYQDQLDYFNAKIGDNITLFIDIKYDGSAANISNLNSSSNTLLAGVGLMSAAAGKQIPKSVERTLKAANSNLNDAIIKRNFTVASTYEKSNGKFPISYGAVAMIDCHYVLDYVYEFARDDYAPRI